MDTAAFSIREEEGGTLILEGECAIMDCERMRDALVEALGRLPRVFLDISGLERADLTFFQLLYAAGLSASESGKTFRCGGRMNESVRKIASVAGFFDNNGMKQIWESEV